MHWVDSIAYQKRLTRNTIMIFLYKWKAPYFFFAYKKWSVSWMFSALLLKTDFPVCHNFIGFKIQIQTIQYD